MTANAQNILITAMQLKLEKQDLADQLELQITATMAARTKAEQASLEKSQLLAATSHDLRQPIHRIFDTHDLLRATLSLKAEVIL